MAYAGRTATIIVLILIATLFAMPKTVLAGSCLCKATHWSDPDRCCGPVGEMATVKITEDTCKTIFDWVKVNKFELDYCKYFADDNCSGFKAALSGVGAEDCSSYIPTPEQITCGSETCQKTDEACKTEPDSNCSSLGGGLQLGGSKCFKGFCYLNATRFEKWKNTPSLFGIKASLEIKKPVIEIKIPELTFSDIAQNVDEEGYLHLPYIGEYLAALYKFAMVVASIVAVVLLIMQGAKVITSGGGEAKMAAYKRIAQIIIGLFLVWGSYFILYNINPDLVNFKVLKVKYIEAVPLSEAKSDEADSSFDSVAAPSCLDPNITINDLSKFDPNLSKEYSDMAGKLTPDQIALYKKAVAAASGTNVPWEVLATIHFKEAGMRNNGSILNGGKFCNTANDGDLLKWCSECSSPTQLNDLICGVRKIRHKAGGSGDLSPANLNLVKTVFCKYNGCFTCPDNHPYVAANFDKNHTNIPKQVHDCVPQTCHANATSDFTVNPPQRNKGCAITVFSNSSHPNIGLSNYCMLNQIKSCGTQSGDKTTYKYNTGKVSDSNTCGSWTNQTRAGALGIYAYILQLESQGKIQK